MRTLALLLVIVLGAACRSHRAPSEDEPLPYFTPKIQLHPRHLRAVARVIRRIPRCRLLIWGTGYDSKLWCAVNRGGTTLFIEDAPKWAKLASEQMPCRVVMTYYPTRLSQADELLKDLARLRPLLPDDLLATKWDVIVVDAPAGHYLRSPGRMGSIYMSSQLSHHGSHIFVDDYQRRVERLYSDTFLRPRFGDPLVYPERGLFAHFRRTAPKFDHRVPRGR